LALVITSCKAAVQGLEWVQNGHYIVYFNVIVNNWVVVT